MTETERIRDLLDRVVAGDAWHGPSLLALLANVPHELAARRPIAGAHSIWELVLHAGTWQEIVRRRLAGEPWTEAPAAVSWPPVGPAGRDGWREAVARLEEGHRRLAEVLAATPDDRLDDLVTGGDHSVHVMLHGLIHHHLYHAGQIALLKRAAGVDPV
jgi:uncharacterized damage-inducible protein DinB